MSTTPSTPACMLPAQAHSHLLQLSLTTATHVPHACPLMPLLQDTPIGSMDIICKKGLWGTPAATCADRKAEQGKGLPSEVRLGTAAHTYRRLLQCVQVPGNIRRAEHFCSFLRQLVSYMRERISVQAVEQESCTAFLAALQEQMSVDGAPWIHWPHPVTVHGGAGVSLCSRGRCSAAHLLPSHLSWGVP